MFGNKFDDLVGLYKNTFVLIGKDKDLLRPMFTMGIYSCISVVLGYGCFYFFMGAKKPELGFLFLLSTMAYVPISAFLRVRQQAALSWMSYEVLTGKDTDIDAGVNRLKGLNGKLFLIAMVNVFLSKERASGKDEKNQGFKAFLSALLLSVLKEVWDVVQNFLIPTLTIEKCDLDEGVAKLKTMKKNIPAAVSGAIGMDVIGGMTMMVLSIFGFPMVVLGAGAGYFMPQLFPESWLIHATNGHAFNTLPLFSTMLVTSLLMTVVSAAADGLKTIYYSTFYTSLNRPMDIREEMRGEITQYLNFRNKTKGYDFFAALKEKVRPEDKLVMSANPEFTQAEVNKLKRAFESNLSQGHTPPQIGAFLVKKGFKKELIEFSFQEFVKEEVAEVLPLIKSKSTEGYSKEEVQKFLAEKGIPECVVKRAFKAA